MQLCHIVANRPEEFEVKTAESLKRISGSALAIERIREQRSFGRRPVFKAAIIALGDGRRLSATVLDLSEGGAKLKGPNPELLNGEFDLEIPEDDLVIKCRVAHVEEGIAGIAFVKPPRRLSWAKR